MYHVISLLSLAYIGYNIYTAVKGTVPKWIEKRIYNLRNSGSYKDLDQDRLDSTPIGQFSQFYFLTILASSFLTLTYIIGWGNMSKNVILLAGVTLATLAITFYIRRNLRRWVHYYTSEFTSEEKKEALKKGYEAKTWADKDKLNERFKKKEDGEF